MVRMTKSMDALGAVKRFARITSRLRRRLRTDIATLAGLMSRRPSCPVRICSGTHRATCENHRFFFPLLWPPASSRILRLSQHVYTCDLVGQVSFYGIRMRRKVRMFGITARIRLR
jgi:hypothetical protein